MEADEPLPTLTVTGSVPPIDTLVVGVSEFGLAGLTAVDYLVEQIGMEQVGYLSGGSEPAIVPFDAGEPRHHTRLYADGDAAVGVLVGERFVGTRAAPTVADAVVGFCTDQNVPSITALAGVPVAHGPDDHAPFYVATPDYRSSYLDDELRPMGTGFLDGLSAELVRRGLDADGLAVGVFTTPVHAQAPDAAAAIRLVEALSTVHDLSVDTGPLEAFAESVEAHYRALADRVAEQSEADRPDDRMYM